MPALNKQYRANGCGIHTCQLLEEGEKAKGKKPQVFKQTFTWPISVCGEAGPRATIPHFFDCGFFAWSITSPLAFVCAYLQTSLSLGLTSQSL